MLSNSWKYPLILTVPCIVQAEASLTRAKFTNGVLVFCAGRLLRLLIGGGIVGFSALIIARAGNDETWALVALSGVVVLCCFAWPSTVVLTDAGVEEARWWRTKVTVPWSEVTAIDKGAQNDYIVYGRNGQRIGFDRFKVDGLCFAHEVEFRANLKQVTDTTAPVTLGLSDPPSHTPWSGERKKSRRERKQDHIAGI
jgi:hypothetical protein